MNIENLKIGDKIKIEDNTYDIISIQNEATVEEDGSNELFVAIYLHELGNKSLKPTHMLANYIDKGKIYLVSLLGDKDELEINLDSIELA